MIDSRPWITPLLLMPGVALLILSTAVRYNRLHDEVHEAEKRHVGHAVIHDATLAFRARGAVGRRRCRRFPVRIPGGDRSERTVCCGNPVFEHTVDS